MRMYWTLGQRGWASNALVILLLLQRSLAISTPYHQANRFLVCYWYTNKRRKKNLLTDLTSNLVFFNSLETLFSLRMRKQVALFSLRVEKKLRNKATHTYIFKMYETLHISLEVLFIFLFGRICRCVQ